MENSTQSIDEQETSLTPGVKDLPAEALAKEGVHTPGVANTRNKSPFSLVVLGIVVVFTLGTAGFLYWQNRELQTQIAQINNAKQTEELSKVDNTETPTLATDPTAGWKTFTNVSLNYSFKLPTEWKVIEHSSNFTENESYKSLSGQQIDVTRSNNSIKNCKGDCPVIDATEPTTINNQAATRFVGYMGTVGGNIPHRIIVVEVKVGSKYLDIYYHPSTENVTNLDTVVAIPSSDIVLFNQAFSTFRFSSEKESSVNDYHSKIAGVTLPMNWVERGIKLGPDSIREFVSSDECRSIFIKSLGPSIKSVADFAQSYNGDAEPVVPYKAQYSSPIFDSLTIAPMNTNALSITFIKFVNEMYLATVQADSQDGPPKCKVTYDEEIKGIIESLKFN
jgi:hypothetical protein